LLLLLLLLLLSTARCPGPGQKCLTKELSAMHCRRRAYLYITFCINLVPIPDLAWEVLLPGFCCEHLQ
jgi:hypothetical protein